MSSWRKKYSGGLDYVETPGPGELQRDRVQGEYEKKRLKMHKAMGKNLFDDVEGEEDDIRTCRLKLLQATASPCLVYYFKARSECGDYVIYMGLDKHENEDLIKYGLPEDIWFHADKLSSAHMYRRMHKGQTTEMISPELLEDCAQLVKANSIQGPLA